MMMRRGLAINNGGMRGLSGSIWHSNVGNCRFLSSQSDHIIVEKQDHIMKICINRPEKYNAFSTDMFDSIGRALHELHSDPDLRVGLIHANGNHFTSGLDLPKWSKRFATGNLMSTDMGKEGKDGKEAPHFLDPLGIFTEPCCKPIVAAGQGFCYTVGTELFLACDVRVAAEDCRFAMLEVGRGIYPVGGATMRLPFEIGWGNAMKYLLTGGEWTAQEAHKMGMIQEITPVGEQLDKALEIAVKISKQAPLGVMAALKSSRICRKGWEDKAASRLLPDIMKLMPTEDVKEGVQSFVERREAVFKGK